MMAVLEKEGQDGTVRPYTLRWTEAGMRAASGGSEQAPALGRSQEVQELRLSSGASLSAHRILVLRQTGMAGLEDISKTIWCKAMSGGCGYESEERYHCRCCACSHSRW